MTYRNRSISKWAKGATLEEMGDAVEGIIESGATPSQVTTVVKGVVQSGLDEDGISQALLATVPESVHLYSDYALASELTLTTSLQKVTDWVEGITPENITHASGTFTNVLSGTSVVELILERIYENDDNSPQNQIYVHMEIRKNGDLTPTFSRTAPISAATANDEPALDTFTTPFIFESNENDYYEVYVSANEDGADPDDTRLIAMKVTAKLVKNTPVVIE